MNTTYACFAALCFTLGCAAPKYTIQIDSEPRAARVEVNNEDLGMTPTTFTVEGTGNGEFMGSWGPAPYIVFSCTPPANSSGLYPQKKTFRPNGFFQAGDKIPKRIFFDLRKPQEGLQLDVAPQNRTQ